MQVFAFAFQYVFCTVREIPELEHQTARQTASYLIQLTNIIML